MASTNSFLHARLRVDQPAAARLIQCWCTTAGRAAAPRGNIYAGGVPIDETIDAMRSGALNPAMAAADEAAELWTKRFTTQNDGTSIQLAMFRRSEFLVE